MVANAGKICPVCASFGLFKVENGYRCEECLVFIKNEDPLPPCSEIKDKQ